MSKTIRQTEIKTTLGYTKTNNKLREVNRIAQQLRNKWRTWGNKILQQKRNKMSGNIVSELSRNDSMWKTPIRKTKGIRRSNGEVRMGAQINSEWIPNNYENFFKNPGDRSIIPEGIWQMQEGNGQKRIIPELYQKANPD